MSIFQLTARPFFLALFSSTSAKPQLKPNMVVRPCRGIRVWKGEHGISYSFILRSASDFTGNSDTSCWLSALKPKPGPRLASTSDFLEGQILTKENEYSVPDSAVHKNKQVVLVIYTGLMCLNLRSTLSIYWFKAKVCNELGSFSFPN